MSARWKMPWGMALRGRRSSSQGPDGLASLGRGVVGSGARAVVPTPPLGGRAATARPLLVTPSECLRPTRPRLTRTGRLQESSRARAAFKNPFSPPQRESEPGRRKAKSDASRDRRADEGSGRRGCAPRASARVTSRCASSLSAPPGQARDLCRRPRVRARDRLLEHLARLRHELLEPADRCFLARARDDVTYWEDAGLEVAPLDRDPRGDAFAKTGRVSVPPVPADGPP